MEANPSLSPWLATFLDGEMEAAFRLSRSRQYRLQLFTMLGVMVAAALAFLWSDYHLEIEQAVRTRLLLVRLLILLSSLGMAALALKSRRYAVLDAGMLIWALLMCASVLFINSTRPPTYSLHVLVDLVVIFVIYLAVPTPILHQLVLGVSFSLGNLILIYVMKTHLTSVDWTVTLVAIGLANFFGLFLSYRLQLALRQSYAAYAREKTLKEALERSREELKTLHGILPICAACKKIRDGEGNWHTVETYIRDRSEAQFSHSLCPDCAEQLYPDYKKDR